MSRIRILPDNISNRIAAGEVIERPASVVKELVENAIDAGATSILVEIGKAGSKLIAVSDNGSGMDQDDALMCLEPHATSKIKQERDIEQILTLGFRGEALPSIASVSRFCLKTRQHDALEGTEVVIQGGKIIKTSPAGCAPGTYIAIRDLFFNTPARKKFLSSQATEEKHIQETVYMLSLPYPDIAFELIIDGRRIFSSAAHDNLLPRIKTYFGKNYAENIMPAAWSQEGVKLTGYVARHGLTRNTRREQRTFVNGRPVEAPAIYRGIREGFGGLVEKGRFPPVILFLHVDPATIDVNVHPAKREIRFKQEYVISRAVSEAVGNALRQAPSPSITVDPALSLKSLLHGAEIAYQPPTVEQSEMQMPEPTPMPEIDNTPMPRPMASRPVIAPPLSGQAAPDDMPEAGIFDSPAAVAPGNEESPRLPGSGPMRALGSLDNTYVLAAGSGGLLIIDQHAAHERIMFERLLKNADNSIPAQGLLLPLNLELSRSEAAFLTKNSSVFERLGFEIAPLSGNSVIINAIPASLRQENIGGMLRDIIDTLLEDGGRGKVDLETIARIACKAAVKAHDKLTPDEAQALLRQMAECELPFSCPHGRPTVINISIRELEKRFGRR